MSKKSTAVEEAVTEEVVNETVAEETEHSPKFDTIKTYYDNFVKGIKPQWSKERVYNAVGKGWITAEEYEEITGEKYE